MPDPVPVILLSRLAVDRAEQGKRLGSHLLRDALERSVGVSEHVGIRAILVHALHGKARAFYEHFGFERSPTDELHLVLSMNDASAYVSGGAPPVSAQDDLPPDAGHEDALSDTGFEQWLEGREPVVSTSAQFDAAVGVMEEAIQKDLGDAARIELRILTDKDTYVIAQEERDIVPTSAEVEVAMDVVANVVQQDFGDTARVELHVITGHGTYVGQIEIE